MQRAAMRTSIAERVQVGQETNTSAWSMVSEEAQLIVASRKVKRPMFKPHERGLIVLLAHFVSGWRNALLLVKPETVLRWHREGFRLLWKLKSRTRGQGEPRISKQVIALIRQMARTISGSGFYLPFS
jgi:hypothetical protein